MKLKRIYIDQFGKHDSLLVNFENNFNLLIGPNESGKSTLLTFILTAFYGFDRYSLRRVERNERMRFTPWSGSRFGGHIVFERENTTYRLERSFGETASKDEVTLTNEHTGKEISIPKRMEPGEYLFGLKRDEFLNTIYIGQLSTAMEKDEDIRQKLMALKGGQAMDTSIHEIEEILGEELRVISPPRAKGLLQKAEERLKDLELEQQEAIDISEQARKKRADLEEAQAKLSRVQEQLKDLKLEQDLRQIELKQKELLDNKERLESINKIDQQISEGLEELSYSSIEELEEQDDLSKAEEFLNRWQKLETQKENIDKQNKSLIKKQEELPKKDELKRSLENLNKFSKERRNYLKSVEAIRKKSVEEKRLFTDNLNLLEQNIKTLRIEQERTKQRSKTTEEYSNLNESIKQQNAEKNHFEKELEKLEQGIVEKNQEIGKINLQLNQQHENFANQIKQYKAEQEQKIQELRIKEETEQQKIPLSIFFIFAALGLLGGILYLLIGQGQLILTLFLFGVALIFFVIGFVDTSKKFKKAQSRSSLLEKIAAIEAVYQTEQKSIEAKHQEKTHDLQAIEKELRDQLASIDKEKTRLTVNLENKDNRLREDQKKLQDLELQLNQIEQNTQVNNKKLILSIESEDSINLLITPVFHDNYTRAILILEQDATQNNITQNELIELDDALNRASEELESYEYKASGELIKEKNQIDQDHKKLLGVLSESPFKIENVDLDSDQMENEISSRISIIERNLHDLEQIEQGLKEQKEAEQKNEKEYLELRAESQQRFLKVLTDCKTLTEAETYYKKKVQQINELKTLQGRKLDRQQDIEKQLAGMDLESLEKKLLELEAEIKQLQDLRSVAYQDLDLEVIGQQLKKLREQESLWHTTTGNVQGELKNIYSQTRMLQEIEEELVHTQDEWKKLSEQVKDYELALKMIKSIDDELQKSFGPQINERTSEILSAITGEEQQGILIDGDFEAKLEDTESKMLREAAYFSSGKIDQIYLSLRLAIALTLYSGADGEILPFVFDDSLVQYDEQRTERTLAYLKQIAEEENRQIIFSTCHPAYEELMDYAHVIYLNQK